MKRLILGILVAAFIFSIAGNCFADASTGCRKPTKKPATKGMVGP